MCDPVSLLAVSAAVSAASAGANYASGMSTARKQQQNINDAEARQQADVARQMEQQWTAGAGEANEFAMRAHKDAALFEVITGEYGGGRTADRAVAVQVGQVDEGLATIGYNARMGLSESGFRSKAVAQNASAQRSTVATPSLLGTALTIGSAALDYQTGMNKLKKGPLNG